MRRQKYQEKYIKKRLDDVIDYRIKEIEDDFNIVSELFTELNREVNKTQNDINVLEDYIEKTKIEIKEVVEELKEANTEKYSKGIIYNLSGSFIGMGLGSLVYLYNPYIAIGSIISGGITGWLVSSKVNQFIKEANERESEHKVTEK